MESMAYVLQRAGGEAPELLHKKGTRNGCLFYGRYGLNGFCAFAPGTSEEWTKKGIPDNSLFENGARS